MMSTFAPALHAGTPSVSVLDGRGNAVRQMAWLRTPDTDPDANQVLTTRHEFDAAGHLVHSTDPRLGDARQADAAVAPNLAQIHDLLGRVLRADSVDGGRTVVLHDAEGRPMQVVDASGRIRRSRYERDDRPGRLLAVEEWASAEDKNPTVLERLVWAGTGPDDIAHNLAGQCVRHYDPAGMAELESVSLGGSTLSERRWLLPVEAQADWKDDEGSWKDALAEESYRTRTTVDAAGAVLTQTDARGNRQRMSHDLAGHLAGSWLRLGGEEQERAIVRSVAYAADGRTLSEEHGNGVVTEYGYDARTTRLTRITTRRPGAAKARLLQDLRYESDPHGNVIAVTDDADAVRFWNNQKIEPTSTYTYDTLDRLVGATGREMVSARRQDDRLPELLALAGPGACTNYRRRYSYDAADNLVEIRHLADKGGGYTTRIVVSDRSNRAVAEGFGLAPGGVDAAFDAGGCQHQFQPGQDLAWTGRGELARVAPVSREGEEDDAEWYRYAGSGWRVEKVSERRTQASRRLQRAVYLPGLELRSKGVGTAAVETYQVIVVGAGRADVRVLLWESNPPAGLSGPLMRYGYGGLTGNLQMELDEAGDLISREEYYPYGGTALWIARSAVEARHKTVRYSGKERDATGLYYHGHRYYQPWIGRWLSADPAGIVDGLNLYAYVGNNPIGRSDPNGLWGEGYFLTGIVSILTMALSVFFYRRVLSPSMSRQIDPANSTNRKHAKPVTSERGVKSEIGKATNERGEVVEYLSRPQTSDDYVPGNYRKKIVPRP